MKIVLVVLILCFFVNSISAFFWFNFRSNQQTKQVTESSTTRRSTLHSQQPAIQQQNRLHKVNNPFHQTMMAFKKNNVNHSPLQRFVNRQQYQVRNTTAIQHRTNGTNKKSSQIIPRNRFQAIAYQQQHRSLNNPFAYRQTNRVINNTNNQAVHPRFRPILPTSKNNTKVVNSSHRRIFSLASVTKSIVAKSKSNSSSITKNNIQPIRLRSALAKAIVPSTKTGLRRTLTTKAIANSGSQDRQRLLADYHYQKQLRALYQRLYEENAARNHLNVDSALKKQKRDDQPDTTQSNTYYPMAFVRAQTFESRKLRLIST